jgi:hypothetical protein
MNEILKQKAKNLFSQTVDNIGVPDLRIDDVNRLEKSHLEDLFLEAYDMVTSNSKEVRDIAKLENELLFNVATKLDHIMRERLQGAPSQITSFKNELIYKMGMLISERRKEIESPTKEMGKELKFDPSKRRK